MDECGPFVGARLRAIQDVKIAGKRSRIDECGPFVGARLRAIQDVKIAGKQALAPRPFKLLVNLTWKQAGLGPTSIELAATRQIKV